MARTGIGRTIVLTIATVDYFDVQNNEHRDEEIEIWGDYDLEHAQNACAKKLGISRLLVTSVKHKSWYCTQTYEEFFNNSFKTNFKEY